MKRFVCLFLFFFLFLLQAPLYAKEYNQQDGTSGTVKITTTATSATVVYTRTSTAAIQKTIALWKTRLTDGTLQENLYQENFSFAANDAGAYTINFTSLGSAKTYYITIGSLIIPIETEEFQTSGAPLKFEKSGGRQYIAGKIDPAVSDPATLCVQLEYIDVLEGDFATGNTPTKVGPFTARDNFYGTGDIGLDDEGNYYFILSNLTPGHTYSFKETFHTKEAAGCGTEVLGKPVIQKFNTDKGLVLTTPSDEQDDFEKRSYRLLAPLPGLSVLLDPDLCQEQQAANPGQGKICDINDFLNYAFKIMIGLAAVVLVLRIMLEGFKIATSDVPFIVVDAKSKLWQAVGGLLLALTAWLILNTINPKLVSNEINIPSVSLDVEEEPYPTNIPQDPATAPTGSVAKCTEGVISINTSGGNMVVCKRISAQIQTLINKAWSEGIKLSGGGFRTPARQIELRKQNCGAAYVYIKNAKCNPPTAFPGNSNHESGLAIDFTCEGKTIGSQDNKCFLWLQKNATGVLKNFSKEPWHWSINGR